jgi:MOSC domain-containing protein YiiM
MNAQQIKIISVNLSAIRNQPKKQVSKLLVSRKGVDGDGDTDYWNREISVLSKEAYTDLGEEYGFWGENITVEGMDLTQLKPMDCLISEEARLKVTITAHTVKSDSLIRFHQSGPKDIPIGGLFVRAQKKLFYNREWC